MKTIKIFFASSEELEDDRNAFGNLIRRLSKAYEKRGIKLELFEWEDYDAAYNNCRKQDEYNEQVRASDMFLAVFHTKAGKFTIEEFNVAFEEFKEKKSPKIYVYCKDLKEGENESALLKEFKEKLINDMGHYWCRYTNRDTMNLNFVLQLQIVEGYMNEVRIEDGKVLLEDTHIACIDNLPFASLNEEFNKMSNRMKELHIRIEKVRSKVEKYPEDEDFVNELQLLQNEYNELKKGFAEYQGYLFDAAKHIVGLQGKRITERMRRAINAFNEGKVRESKIILEEVETDAKTALADYMHSKELAELRRQNVVVSIEEILLKISFEITDTSRSADDCFKYIDSLYRDADEMANTIKCNTGQHIKILINYATFLSDFGHYEESNDLYFRLLKLSNNDPESMLNNNIIYDYIGSNYNNLRLYDKALEFYSKSLPKNPNESGCETLQIANSYRNIGLVYENLCDFDKALDSYTIALTMLENVLVDHKDVAIIHSEIGILYSKKDEGEKASYHLLRAIDIGENNPNAYDDIFILSLYGNLGNAFYNLACYDSAREFYEDCLDICEKNYGPKHSITAEYYAQIGSCNTYICFDDTALRYFLKSLEILRYSLGEKHPKILRLYMQIGDQYIRLGDRSSEYSKDNGTYNYDKALEYYEKVLAIQKDIYRENHPDIALTYVCIAEVYQKLGVRNRESAHLAKEFNLNGYSEPLYYNKALKYYEDALKIQILNFSENHLETATTNKAIGYIYYHLCKYDDAHNYYTKAIEAQKQLLGSDHFETEYTQIKLNEINEILNTREYERYVKLHWSLKILWGIISLTFLIAILPITLLWIFLFWKKNIKKTIKPSNKIIMMSKSIFKNICNIILK